MGKYGNIDGIATLTSDPLALDNINKFNIGDRVMCNDNGKSGTVLDIDTDKYGCTVRFDDTEGTWIECDQLSKNKERGISVMMCPFGLSSHCIM